MKYIFSREISGDIAKVEDSFRDNLLPWWSDIEIYYNRMQDDLTWNVLPAVVLSVYKHFDLNRSLAVAMASVFKTVYFSNTIHAQIKDDEEGQIHDNKLQFAILVGDYIFGTVLKSLVRSGTTSLVGIMSDMICELNEGMVLQSKTSAEKTKVLEKTRAPLYGTSFLSAARLAGLNLDKQEVYRKMGQNLGMSFELYADKQSLKDARPYIHNTEILMGRCNDNASKPGTILEKVIKDLHLAICGNEKVAVV
jgi:hypothetical protein